MPLTNSVSVTTNLLPAIEYLYSSCQRESIQHHSVIAEYFTENLPFDLDHPILLVGMKSGF